MVHQAQEPGEPSPRVVNVINGPWLPAAGRPAICRKVYESFIIEDVPLPTFLSLPERSGKPRVTGLTHVLDKGASVVVTESVLASAAPYVDLWKFGWGTAYVDPALAAKLSLLAAADVRACVGGTLMEIAWSQRKDREYLDWADDVGFGCVEVSRGVASMPVADKHDLIRRAAERFVVISEVGSKDPHQDLTPAQWTAEVAGDLAAGARWVIIEGRESGTVGLYRADGSVRAGVVTAVLEVAGLDTVVFEAPRKDQQAWFIREYGPEVNLANIALDEALGLETLRRGLRADTFEMSAGLVTT
jgi:phosphosulfolactate synthase